MKTGKTLLWAALILPWMMMVEGCQKQKAFASFGMDVPQPTVTVTKVALDEEQQVYVQNGNRFSFDLLDAMFQGSSLFISPLSAQFAMGMAVNGARGETADEMTQALGYGKEGAESVNAYCKSLLEQLPAVDSKVKLRMANAIIVNTPYILDEDFRSTLRNYYYAPAEVVPFSESGEALAAVNDWAARNTDGMIHPMLDDIRPGGGIAYLLSAVYFKAAWQEPGANRPLFDPNRTVKDQDFLLGGGEKTKVDYMTACSALPFVDAGDFSMVSVPYSNGHYCMYVLLPKEESLDAVRKLVPGLGQLDWEALTASMQPVNVRLQLPKFTIEKAYELKEPLEALGVKAAFGRADFSAMLAGEKTTDGIAQIIQKNRINITEWGTEAASVSSPFFPEATDDGKDHQIHLFQANHPFVYVMAEKSSNVILFEGVFCGE